MKRFYIHFQGEFYSNPLYDARGREIFDLQTAIDEAIEQFGETGWEVYNGIEGENRITDSIESAQ